jgi:hypothetical protein
MANLQDNPHPWLTEKILQRYWVECCSDYKRKDGTKIISGKYNRLGIDRYPDTYCILDDGNNTEVPVEVEWNTKNFDRHGHDISILRENDGFLVVLTKDANFELEQIEIDVKNLVQWFERNSGTIMEETIQSKTKSKIKRSFPKLWFHYVSKNAKKNFENISLERGIWGVPGEPRKFPRISNFMDIQKNDLIAFLLPYSAPAGSRTARLKLDKWKYGEFSKVEVFRVTKGYYYDETPVWKEEWGQYFPHRFRFHKIPVSVMNNVPIKRLSRSTQISLHSAYSASPREGAPFELVEMMGNSKQ